MTHQGSEEFRANRLLTVIRKARELLYREAYQLLGEAQAEAEKLERKA